MKIDSLQLALEFNRIINPFNEDAVMSLEELTDTHFERIQELVSIESARRSGLFEDEE